MTRTAKNVYEVMYSHNSVTQTLNFVADGPSTVVEYLRLQGDIIISIRNVGRVNVLD